MDSIWSPIRPMDSLSSSRVTWEQVRELALAVDVAASRQEATAEHAARLARLVLEFDETLTRMRPRAARASEPPPQRTG